MSELEKFKQLMEAEWEFRLQQQPLLATRVGDMRYNDKLIVPSEENYEFERNKNKEFLDELKAISTDNFSQSESVNYQLFKQMLEERIRRFDFKGYRIPLSKTGGIHSYLPTLYRFVPLNNISDFNDLLSRYSQIPTVLDNIVLLIKAGVKDGQIPPKITLETVVDSIIGQITSDVKTSPYFKPFQTFPKSISKEEQSVLQKQAELVITEQINPKLKYFSNFLSEEYIPAARDDISISAIPQGEEYYRFNIKSHTSLDLSATEIHEIGLSEVKRIREEMLAVLQEINFEGSLKDFFKYLREDPSFYPKTKEELLEKTALVLKRIDGLLPQLFKTLPRLPYGIQEIPDFQAPRSTTAYYMPGNADGTKAGNYYVNTYNLSSRPLYEIEALSLHEAVPGHHLQLALQLELDIPMFRKFNNYTSFVEGWGLYAERLGLECGFYTDPYSNFGRLSYEMWRALRLVVDTGMHALDWSRQKSIDFMAENSSLSLLNIQNEIDRYIAWPGQALAYKLGELKIRELRQLAEDKFQEKFDIRQFHEEVLKHGSLPLNILEENINNWINHSLTSD